MKIGFAFCGSFCNHPELLKLYEDIAREHGLGIRLPDEGRHLLYLAR